MASPPTPIVGAEGDPFINQLASWDRSPADPELLALCATLIDRYLTADDANRAALRRAVRHNTLIREALDVFLERLREQPNPVALLRATLTIVALTGGLGDWRDTIVWLTRIWSRAIEAGIDPRPHFTEIAATADDSNVHGLSGQSTRGLFQNAVHLVDLGQTDVPSDHPFAPADPTAPCPQCGRPLRTAQARQCFSCGADWHGQSPPRRRPPAPTVPPQPPLSIDELTSTDEFRHLCQMAFPLNEPVSEAPRGGWLTGIAQRLGLSRRPQPHDDRPPGWQSITPRQTQLLFAALIEMFLADRNVDEQGNEYRDVARLIERLADGAETEADRERVRRATNKTFMMYVGAEDLLCSYTPAVVRAYFGMAHTNPDIMQDSALRQMFPVRSRDACDLLRDVLGHPLRRIMIDPSWRTDTVVQVAASIDETRSFDLMPILADALAEAGCDEPEVLNHCWERCRHWRGCWVLDGLLGR